MTQYIRYQYIYPAEWRDYAPNKFY